MRSTSRTNSPSARPGTALLSRGALASLVAAALLLPSATGAVATAEPSGTDPAASAVAPEAGEVESTPTATAEPQAVVAPEPQPVATAEVAEVTEPAEGTEAAPVSPDGVTLTVEGVIERIMVEHPEAEPVAVGHEDEHVATVLEVGGELYGLPEELEVEGVTGDEVVVTLEADASMSVDDALQEIAVTEPGDTASVLTALPAQSGTLASTSEAGTLNVTLGQHSLTVLPIHWGDTGGASQSSLAGFAASTAQYWNNQSGGRLNISSSSRGFARIADPGSCSSTTLFNAAMAAHGNPPVSATQHVLVWFPYRSDCGGWAGQATIGGGKIWVNGTQLVDVGAHELGHNLGLGHANTMTCTVGGGRVPLAAPATSYCTQQSYGDYADVMGIGQNMATGNLNSAFAEYLGFASVTRVASTPASASVQVAPLASVNAMRALRVDTAEGVVFMDYRPAVAPDTRKTTWAGVQVHVRRVENGVPYTYLLDMQASTAASFAAAALPVGRSWDVPGTKARLGVHAAGSTASLSVSSTAVPFDDGVERFVSHVYRDLFGRAVDPVGLSTWSSQLRSGTPRTEVANSITYSDEYRRRLISESYSTYLGRLPDPVGLDFWLRYMGAGFTIEQMEAGFLASNEYYQQAGSSDSAWVQQLYQHVLGRSAGPTEVNAWLTRLRSGTKRGDVAIGFLLSREHLTAVVDGHYTSLLRRPIDPTGANNWVAAIQTGTRVEAVIGGIIASNEYYALP